MTHTGKGCQSGVKADRKKVDHLWVVERSTDREREGEREREYATQRARTLSLKVKP